MAKKKRTSKGKKAQEVQKKSSSRTLWILGAVAVVAVVALVALLSAGGQDDAGSTTASSSQEQDYIGRYLPVGYSEPTVADRTLYGETIGMTDVTAMQQGGSLELALDSVTTNKIVRFYHTKPDGEMLPLIAYVKPSGDLFVGVSYCPPCEGEGQRIETDGTLTCEACGTKRNLESNEGISGACKLYPLDEVPASVKGDTIVVETSVLDSWTAQPLDRPVG
jgi:hypothetical protein